jgi:hypothetical protein
VNVPENVPRSATGNVPQNDFTGGNIFSDSMLYDIIEDNVDDGVIFDDDIMADWKKEEEEEEEEEEEDISDSDLFEDDSSAKNIPQRALSLLKHIKYFNDHKGQSKNEKGKEDTEANKIKNRKGGGNNDENEDEDEHMIEYEQNNKHVNERCWTSDERYSVTEVSDFNTIDDLNIET